MIKILSFVFNPIQENTYVAYDETGECVIIDAGCCNNSENVVLQKAIADKGLTPVKLLCTHGHFDHIMGNAFVCNTYGIEAYISKSEIDNVRRAVPYASYFDVNTNEVPMPKCFIGDGDEVNFGKSSFKVIATPGHTPGGVCFYSAENELLFSGDTLFCGSIGRTDLPGGDYDLLLGSLAKLIVLPDDTNVFCGHGPKTNIRAEKTTNPFITEKFNIK